MLATLDLTHTQVARSASFSAPRPPQRAQAASLFDRAGVSTARRIEAREHVFCEGDPRTHVFQVEDGVIVNYKVLPDGRRQVMGFAYPGDLIGLGATGEHAFNAQATCPAKVRCIGAQLLEEAAARDPSLALKLYKAVSQELSATRSVLVSIGQHSALERVASFLVMLERRLSESEGGEAGAETVINLPMRRSDIADFLGLTLETVSRTFTKLRSMHAIEIVHGTEVHVVNPALLAKVAGG